MVKGFGIFLKEACHEQRQSEPGPWCQVPGNTTFPHMGSLPASAPPPPIYHVTVWRQLTFAEAEITASLHHLALWTEEYARNTAQQAVGADPWI